MKGFLKKAAVFLAGFLTCLLCCFLYWKSVEKQEIHLITEEDTLSFSDQMTAAGESGVSIRMNDGMIEWYDGSKWNAYETVDELRMTDPYYLAQDQLAAFEAEVVASNNMQTSDTDKDNVWSPLSGTVASTKSSSNSGSNGRSSSSNSRNSGNSGNSGSSGNSSSNSSSAASESNNGSVSSTTGATTPSGGSDSSAGATTPSGGTDSSAGTTTPSGGTDSSAGTTTPSGGTDSSAGTTTPSTGSSAGSTTPSGSTGSSSSGDGIDNEWSAEYE